MSRAGWVSIAITFAILLVAVLNQVGLINLFSPAANAASNTVSSASGLEIIAREFTLLQGCADQEFEQWSESTDLWGCSNSLTSPDINGGTWNGTIDGFSTATSVFSFQSTLGVSGSTVFAGNWRIDDDLLAAWGSDSDVPLVLNSAGLASDEELAGVIVGTSVYDNAIPADSLIVSNVTADGDIVFFTNTGGNSIEALRIDGSSRQLLLPSVDDATTPTLAIGTVGTGFYAEDASRIIFALGGVSRYELFSGRFQGSPPDGPRMQMGGGTDATNPVFLPNRADTDTGVGAATANQLSLISAGNEGIRISGAGNIDLTPTANTDASTSPFLLQNESSASTPGTTVDGQIRLWEDTTAPATGSKGRILFQVNGTTFQVNADSGFTFTNNVIRTARDKAAFAVGHAQWRLDRLDEEDDKFIEFKGKYPGLLLQRVAPEWTNAYLDHLRTQYTIADASLNNSDNVEEIDVPPVSTLAQLNAENPWPDPASYRVNNPTANETNSFRSGMPFKDGDSLVLTIDEVNVDSQNGQLRDVHAVPSTLKDEFLYLLQSDARFLADVKTLLGVP